MTLTLLDKVTISTICLCLCAMLRMVFSKGPKHLRMTMGMTNLTWMAIMVLNAGFRHPHTVISTVGPWFLCSVGLLNVWGLLNLFKQGDIEKQKRLDAGIVSKEDRIYNDWAKPDPE